MPHRGAESWRTQPICLGIWAICAPGLSIHLQILSAPRIGDGSISGDEGGTAIRRPLEGVACPAQASPGRRHGDTMNEAIPVRIYNASKPPACVLTLPAGWANGLGGATDWKKMPKFIKPNQPRRRCYALGYNASDWVVLRSRPGRRDCLLPLSLGHTDISGLPDSSSHLHGSSNVVESKQTGNTRKYPSPQKSSRQTAAALLGQEHKIQEGQASRAGRGGFRSNFALRPDEAVTGKGVQMHPS